VTSVYVDLAATVIDDSAVPDAEALRALQYLREAGLEVVVVASNGTPPSDELREVAHDVVDAPPIRPESQSWYLTTEVERCVGTSARLRTVLLGGTPVGGSVRRCDAVARDVQAAAMEILAAEAMPGKL
jgi:putative intracellular protease/amidase